MIKEEQLLEQKELRDQLASKVEVLEKVKNLLLLPKTDFATTKQVADFYEVSESNIKSLYKEHKDEFDEDGATLYKYDDFKKMAGTTSKMFRGKAIFTFDNDYELEVNPRGARLFTKRVILRMGMLLKTSDIAKEIRTQLLNIEEKTSNEVKVRDINEEQKLALSLGMAQASGDLTAITIATGNLMAFKNRHITRLENDNSKLKQDNKALAGEILKWEDRSKMVFAIRKLAPMLHKPVGYVWSDLYKELKYKYHIDVKMRGEKPYIEHVKSNEWSNVIKSFSALCEDNDISPSSILSSLNGGQK